MWSFLVAMLSIDVMQLVLFKITLVLFIYWEGLGMHLVLEKKPLFYLDYPHP